MLLGSMKFPITGPIREWIFTSESNLSSNSWLLSGEVPSTSLLSLLRTGMFYFPNPRQANREKERISDDTRQGTRQEQRQGGSG